MKILILMISLVLSGCVATETKIEYVDRPVPYAVAVPAEIPEPMILNEPFLPIKLLEEENINDPDLIAKYTWKTIILLNNYGNSLQCMLDAYRTESEPQCKTEE